MCPLVRKLGAIIRKDLLYGAPPASAHLGAIVWRTWHLQGIAPWEDTADMTYPPVMVAPPLLCALVHSCAPHKSARAIMARWWWLVSTAVSRTRGQVVAGAESTLTDLFADCFRPPRVPSQGCQVFCRLTARDSCVCLGFLVRPTSIFKANYKQCITPTRTPHRNHGTCNSQGQVVSSLPN